MSYTSSIAVDKNEEDQNISGTAAVTITASNVLWDFNGDFDDTVDDFIVPATGIYQFDIQCRFKNMVNVTAIELAVFRRGTGEGGSDEYWFIIDKKYLNIVDTTLQLSGNTRFDFVEGQRYCIKAILSGILPSAKVAGDSIYTAWGFSYVSDMTGH